MNEWMKMRRIKCISTLVLQFSWESNFLENPVLEIHISYNILKPVIVKNKLLSSSSSSSLMPTSRRICTNWPHDNVERVTRNVQRTKFDFNKLTKKVTRSRSILVKDMTVWCALSGYESNIVHSENIQLVYYSSTSINHPILVRFGQIKISNLKIARPT